MPVNINPVLFIVEPYYLAYHSLILLALILSVLSFLKVSKRFIYLVAILLITFLMELLTAIFQNLKINGFAWMYHIFSLIEYSTFCMYYIKSCSSAKLKVFVKISIPVYILFGFCTSSYLYDFKSLPALNIDMEGILLFIIYTHLLFNIDVDLNMGIYSHPDFWISTGVLIFFGGVFIFFGLYPNIIHMDKNKTLELFGMIAKPLNVIFYICFIIGFICSIHQKKYLAI